MNKKLQLFTAVLSLWSLSMLSQVLPNRGCGTGTLSPQFETWLNSLTPSSGKFNGGQTQSVYNIPVIVHVIHNNEPLNTAGSTTGGNITAAQIQDQINILNKDFNGLNADTILIPAPFKPVQGKFQFNFCLAVVNPTGGVLAEPGIERINRNTLGFTAPPYSTAYITSTVKPATIWDPTRYMNMWVCGISGGILGFATFPAVGSSGLVGLPSSSATTDGLVMRNDAFGSIGTAVSGAPYNLGRTATHEIGHWLGLIHVWGDNGQCGASDYCADTPPQQGGTATPAGCNYGCPTYPLHANTCTLSGQSNPNGDMFMNYMDYTNDACMYMFTKDQKNRAQLVMTNSPLRASLLTSTVCNLPTAINDIGIMYVANPTYSQNINCLNTIAPSIVIHNFASNTITAATFSYNVDGVNTATMGWTGNLAPNGTQTVFIPTIISLANGSHTFNVGVYNPNSALDPNLTNNVNNQIFSISTLSLNITGATTICPGGVATLTASGATNYTWGPPPTAGATATFSPSVTTTYVLAGSNGSCTVSKNFTVVVTSAAAISATSPSLCSGGNGTISVSGGVNYTLQPGPVVGAGPNFAVNPSVTTVYTLTGLNAGGCTGITTSTVTVGALPSISLSVNPPGGVCAGGSATLLPSGACSYTYTGGSSVVNPTATTVYTVIGASCGGCVSSQTVSVPVTASTIALAVSASSPSVCTGGSVVLGATGAGSYTWNPSGSHAASIVVNPTATVTYSLTGSAGACVSNTVVTITTVPNPTVSVNSQTICPGGAATLVAAGASSYQWNTGSTTSVIVVSPSVNTTYTVVGNSNSCADVKTASVTIGSGISVNLNSVPASVCYGGTTTISATGATSYTWNNGANGSSIVVSPTVASIYTVTGQVGSCSGTAAISVSLASKPSLSINVSPSATLCSATTPITITASGATNYSWSTGGNNSSIVVSPTANVTYSVSGFNPCQADSAVSIYLGVAPPFTVSASPSFTICNGQTAVLSATGSYTSYTWSSPIQTSNTIAVNPSVTTTYTVNASGGACNNSSVITLNVNSTGPVSIISTTNAGCGTTCAGVINASTSGGAGPFTYSLSGSTCTTLPCQNMCSGLYTLYTTDAQGCNSFNIFTIQSSTNNLVATMSTTNTSCSGCTDGVINAGITGGIPPYTYVWIPSGGTSATASNLATGCYTVTINDSGGCSMLANACVGTIAGITSFATDANRLLIYPNPASTGLTIEYPNTNFDYTLMNSLGQIVAGQKNNYHSVSLRLDNCSKGVYMVEVNIAGQKLRKKFLVE